MLFWIAERSIDKENHTLRMVASEAARLRLKLESAPFSTGFVALAARVSPAIFIALLARSIGAECFVLLSYGWVQGGPPVNDQIRSRQHVKSRVG